MAFLIGLNGENINKHMEDCEIKWCQRKSHTLVYVTEIIGDAAYRVGICPICAELLNVKENGFLPEAHVVQSALKQLKSKGDNNEC